MKALILTCNTGQGHNSVSAAVINELEKRGVPAETADSLAFVSEWASKTVCEWHTRLYRYFPKASGQGYSFIEQHPELFDARSPIHRILNLGVDRLYSYISEGGFDVVICPHVISGLMLTEMMRQYPEARLRTAFIATDYTCSPMAEESCLDLYFIPDKSLIPEFEAIGVPKEKIRVIDGIPVRGVFYNTVPKGEAKRALGLSENSPHVLMMFGSMGCGNIPELTALISDSLPDGAALTVVCGTNTAVKDKLGRELPGRKNLRIELCEGRSRADGLGRPVYYEAGRAVDRRGRSKAPADAFGQRGLWLRAV